MHWKFPVAALLPFVLICLAFPAAAQEVSEADRNAARVYVRQGVEAYKNAQFDAAIADFKQAKQLDPTFVTARMYLGTTYASEFIPGAPTEENLAMGRHAIEEYKGILQMDATNLTAIDGIGSVLFNMGGTPFDADKMNESKSYHERHIELRPNDPEPYYWIGVIDWTICYKANHNLRDEWSKENPNGNLAPAGPLPESVRQDFESACAATVNEGIDQIKKAIDLKPDYGDAMAYLNLLYRLKADVETTQDARDEDLKMAEELVDEVKSLKEKRAAAPNPDRN
jgi:tetratricopeptide (TPR) repeat protein